MRDLFNKSFYRFTIGFIGILFASFALAAIVANLDADKTMSASAEGGR